jgi:hypothetical protein
MPEQLLGVRSALFELLTSITMAPRTRAAAYNILRKEQ